MEGKGQKWRKVYLISIQDRWKKGENKDCLVDAIMQYRLPLCGIATMKIITEVYYHLLKKEKNNSTGRGKHQGNTINYFEYYNSYFFIVNISIN